MRKQLLVTVPIGLLLAVDIYVRGIVPVLFKAPEATQAIAPTATVTHTPLPIPSETETATATPSATSSPVGPPTSSPTVTHTPSITPTAPPPEGHVRVQSNCRYGPGAAYLYEWGLYPGDRVTILGRNDLGTWVYIHPWYFVDKCWVATALLDVDGDVFSVPPYYGILPLSDLYQPPRGASAVRQGDQVTISWSEVWMTVDDYRGYLIEAWLCRDRQIVFTPVAIDGTIVRVTDEGGCQEPSSARLYTAEKHGYTAWVRVPWPAFPTPTPTPAETVSP
ncbi:MAG: hypothetical protein WD906_05700 [Anaerolineales bacterium]